MRDDLGNDGSNLGNEISEIDPRYNEATSPGNEMNQSNVESQSPPPVSGASAKSLGTKADLVMFMSNGEAGAGGGLHLAPSMDKVPLSNMVVNTQESHGRHRGTNPTSGCPRVGEVPPELQGRIQETMRSGNVEMFPPKSSLSGITREWCQNLGTSIRTDLHEICESGRLLPGEEEE